MADPKDNIQIKNLNLQIPNRDKIIYTSDNRAIGSMTSAKNVDNTNSTYLRNRIDGTNEIKINNKTIKRELISKISKLTDTKNSYEGAGRICYGDSGDLANITYKTNNDWTTVSSKLESLPPNKYGYNIAHTLVDVDMYAEFMYSNNTYNTNSWHLESWNAPSCENNILTFTRSIKENVIDWTKPVRFYYGNINAEKLYSRNAFSKFNAKLLHIYIDDAKGNYNSNTLESFDKNNSKIILHYYNKNNRIMRYEQNITRPTDTTVWCNMLVNVPEDCYQIEGIEFKLYTGCTDNTNYTNEVTATVEISKFNINVWGLEEFVTTYIKQELIIQRQKIGNVYKNYDIFNQPLLFNNSMRYDLKMSNSPCPKFNKDTYIEFNNDSLREKEFTSVSFYYKPTKIEDITDDSYILGTNLLSAAATLVSGSSTTYNSPTDNVIVLTKDNGTYTLKVFYKNIDDNTDSTKFYNVTEYFKTGVGIKFDISKTMLRINDNIVQADNTVHTFNEYLDDKSILPLDNINDSSALGSLTKSLTLPGCYYNFKLYTTDTNTNSVCLHLPMEEGVGNIVIDVSDTKVNYITDVKYFTISNLGSWDSQDDIFYNTTEGYYTNIVDSDSNTYNLFKDIKYFPKVNDSVASNFEYVYRPLEHGINCGDIKLSSNEILGNGKKVTIDDSNKLFTKTISTLPTITNDLLTLKPKYTFNVFDSSKDGTIASKNGLWHIHGTIDFGLPEAKIGTETRQISIDGLVKSIYTGTIGSLTLFKYSNKFADSLTIDQYYYGSFTTDNKLTIDIDLTTLYAEGKFTTTNTAITAINLTIDKLYFEDNIIASYRYDNDNTGSEYYSGSDYITKYSTDQNTDVKSLYFNNSSSDEIMTYDNFDNISQYTDISNSIIETNVYCNNLLVSPSTAIGTNSNPTTLLDNKNTLKISSKLKNITNGKYYDGTDYDLDVTYYTYLTSCETDNYETYFSIDNVKTSSPSITRGTTNTALYGLTTPFEISTISKLDSSKYGFELNTNSTTNIWYLSCPTIQLETTSTISVIHNNTNPVSLPLLRGYIKGDDYSVTISITTNYTITGNSANVANSDDYELTKTYSSSDITKYDTTLSLTYYNQHVNTDGKTITQTLNFKKPSDIIITSAKITKDSTNTDGNTKKYFTLSITLGDTYGYTYSSECFTFIASSVNDAVSNKSYNNKTFTCTITVPATQTTIDTGQIQIKPNNINDNIADKMDSNNYYTLNNVTYMDQDNYGSGIYYVSSTGNDTNAGTSSNSPILFDTALLRANAYSLLTGKPVYILVTADSSNENNGIELTTSHTINLSNNIYIIGVNNTEFTKISADNIQDKINNGFETTSKITVTIDTDSYIDPNAETQYNSCLLNFVFSSTSYNVNIYNIKFFNIHYTYPSNKYTNYLGYIITSNSDVKLTNCEFNNCSPMYSIIVVSNNRKLTFKNVNYIRTEETVRTYFQFSDYWFDAYEIEVNNCIISLQLVEYTSGTIRTMFASGKAILNNVYIKVICNGTGTYYSDAWLSICDNGQYKYKKNTDADYQYVLNYCTIILDSEAIDNKWNNLILINSRINTIQPSDEMNLLKITNSYLDLPYGIAGYNSKKSYMGNILLENCVYYNTIKNMHYSWNPSKKIDISSNYIITSSYEYTNNIPANITPNSNGVYTIGITSILICAAAPNNTTKDINNNIRSGTTPTIGAVEYYVNNNPVTLTKGLYIDLVNGNDNNSGLSWVSPKKTFKTNLDKVFADSNFAKRYVSEGTLNIYVTSGTETLTSNVNNNLKSCDYIINIIGGYETTACESFTSNQTGITTINGGGDISNINAAVFKAYRLLHSNSAIEVNTINFNNFIFTGFCYSSDFTGNIICCYNSSTKLKQLSFKNCQFTNNYNNIAKIYLKADSGNIETVSFDTCTFDNNISYDYAGVLIFDAPEKNNNSTLTITDCVFKNCYAGYNYKKNGSDNGTDNGGVYYTTYAPKYIEITNCEFNDCKTYDYGGALYIGDNNTSYSGTDSSEITITNCIFNGNESRLDGGAIYLNSTKTKTITIDRCVFCKNTNTSTSGTGGAIYNNVVNENCITNIQNSIFYNNISKNVSALYHYVPKNLTFGYCKLNIYHCTFAENYSTNSFAISIDNYYTTNGTTGNVQNNIIWNNIKNGKTINNVHINWTGGLAIFNSLTNADNKNIMNENSLNDGILDLSLSSLGVITEDPKLVPVLYNYNNNITNNTGLPSLPVCNGSSAINAGKPIANIGTDIRGAMRSTTTPTIGACEYLNRSDEMKFTGICITSDDENDYKVLLDENITINIYYPDLTANAEEALNEIITDKNIDTN